MAWIRKSHRSEQGFTLIELVIIIAVLGIIAAVAIPKYVDMIGEARESACKGALGGLRSAISIYYANTALQNNSATWPPIDSVRTIGVVMAQAIPPNPYQSSSNAPDSVVTGVTKGTIVGTRGGWAYRAATGEIWPNTNTVGENNW
ncbi:MAG: prepilin-type N-terminal cleavage/methylation domain-containing protein [Candidatus Zixiibacteriota bacterium]